MLPVKNNIPLPYAIEYARSSRSTCKKCKRSIPEKALQMSICSDGNQNNWYHFPCFWTKLNRHKDINVVSIKGVDWLSEDDQEQLRDRITKFKRSSRTPEPANHHAALLFSSLKTTPPAGTRLGSKYVNDPANITTIGEAVTQDVEYEVDEALSDKDDDEDDENATEDGSGWPAPLNRRVLDELLCPLCHSLFKEAVVTSCCGNSYCAECIEHKIMESDNRKCPGVGCANAQISIESLIPNRTVRNVAAAWKNSGNARSWTPNPVPHAPAELEQIRNRIGLDEDDEEKGEKEEEEEEEEEQEDDKNENEKEKEEAEEMLEKEEKPAEEVKKEVKKGKKRNHCPEEEYESDEDEDDDEEPPMSYRQLLSKSKKAGRIVSRDDEEEVFGVDHEISIESPIIQTVRDASVWQNAGLEEEYELEQREKEKERKQERKRYTNEDSDAPKHKIKRDDKDRERDRERDGRRESDDRRERERRDNRERERRREREREREKEREKDRERKEKERKEEKKEVEKEKPRRSVHERLQKADDAPKPPAAARKPVSFTGTASRIRPSSSSTKEQEEEERSSQSQKKKKNATDVESSEKKKKAAGHKRRRPKSPLLQGILVFSKLQVEESATNRAKCSKCSGLFGKGELKLRKNDGWEHGKCTFEVVDVFMDGIHDIPGWSKFQKAARSKLIVEYDERKEQLNTKRTTGIPSQELMETTADDPATMLHPSGKNVVPIMHWKARQEQLARKNATEDGSGSPAPQDRRVPAELLCPLCHSLFKEAVVTSCCGNSYCAECIEHKIMETDNRKCPGIGCANAQISIESLIPNRTFRDAAAAWQNAGNPGSSTPNPVPHAPAEPEQIRIRIGLKAAPTAATAPISVSPGSALIPGAPVVPVSAVPQLPQVQSMSVLQPGVPTVSVAAPQSVMQMTQSMSMPQLPQLQSTIPGISLQPPPTSVALPMLQDVSLPPPHMRQELPPGIPGVGLPVVQHAQPPPGRIDGRVFNLESVVCSVIGHLGLMPAGTDCNYDVERIIESAASSLPKRQPGQAGNRSGDPTPTGTF